METVLFYVSAVVALMAALMVITGNNAVHALLYMVVALLALALVFVAYGAYYAAALQVIVYAGAIMVLIIFVIMMLNLGKAAVAREREWRAKVGWRGPALLAGVLVAEVVLVVPAMEATAQGSTVEQVGIALFGPWLIAVEAGSLLLLAGLIAAWHLRRSDTGGL